MRERNLDRESLERLRYEVLEFVRRRGGAEGPLVLGSSAIAEELGVSLEEIYYAIEHLTSESLLEYLGSGPKVRITKAGLLHLDAAGRRRSIRQPKTASRVPGRRMTILLVEDDEDTRKIYRDSLESHGYRVETASQGAEGVAMARRLQPDLILMDIRMPIMDGLRAMEYLKSDRATSRIPIFGISAFGEPAAGRGVSSLSFDEFLVKPLDLNVIIAAIEARIGPPRLRPEMPD